MNLHALRLFYETVACGGVTKAAEMLHISQPAVTAQIRNLEHELKLTLVAAQGRGIRLTPAGELLYRHATRLFAQERQMTQELADYRDGRVGRLRISATYLPANYMLPAWLAAYKQHNEAIEITLTTANSKNAYDKLLFYDADLAFIGGSKKPPEGIKREELMEDELWFVVPPSHTLAGKTIALKEMMREPFILREEGSSVREMLFALCRVHNLGQPSIGLQFNGLNETIRAVMAGYGASFLSAMEVRDYFLQGAVARVWVEGITLTNPIAVCTRKDEEVPPVAAPFLEWVRKQMSGL